MGWDSSDRWNKKADVVAELLNNLTGNPNFELLDHKVTSEGLWSLIKKHANNEIYIYFDLIEKQDKKFYVKSMSEMEGPYYYSCPKSFVERAKVTNEQWRKRWESANGVELTNKEVKNFINQHITFIKIED